MPTYVPTVHTYLHIYTYLYRFSRESSSSSFSQWRHGVPLFLVFRFVAIGEPSVSLSQRERLSSVCRSRYLGRLVTPRACRESPPFLSGRQRSRGKAPQRLRDILVLYVLRFLSQTKRRGRKTLRLLVNLWRWSQVFFLRRFPLLAQTEKPVNVRQMRSMDE